MTRTMKDQPIDYESELRELTNQKQKMLENIIHEKSLAI